MEEQHQPRLSSEGRKTLVQAGQVPSKKWEVTKKEREGDVTKSRFCLENLCKNITHRSCVTVSTARGDVEDTEKESCGAPCRGRDLRLFPSEKRIIFAFGL